jgi:hypothetical protein
MEMSRNSSLAIATTIFAIGFFSGQVFEPIETEGRNPEQMAAVSERSSRPQKESSSPSSGPSAISSGNQTDPGKDLYAALQIQDPATRDDRLCEVVAALGRTDPKKAITLLDQIIDSRKRARLAMFISADWVLINPGEAIAWVGTHSRQLKA